MAQSTGTTNTNWVLLLASAANLMVAPDAMVITTVLTRIGREFSASVESLEWTINASPSALAAFFLMAAALGDRFGRRRMFACGLILFVAASVACALAPNIGWLIAARAVQGIGAAIVMPLGLGTAGFALVRRRLRPRLGTGARQRRRLDQHRSRGGARRRPVTVRLVRGVGAAYARHRLTVVDNARWGRKHVGVLV